MLLALQYYAVRSREHAYLKVNATNEGHRQESLVVAGQVLFGQTQRHVGLLGSRGVACSCLASCSEGSIQHLHEDGAPVGLQAQRCLFAHRVKRNQCSTSRLKVGCTEQPTTQGNR